MRLKDQTLDLLDELEGARFVAPALREFHARLEAFLRAVVATPTSIDEPGSLPLSDAEKELAFLLGLGECDHARRYWRASVDLDGNSYDECLACLADGEDG